MRTDTIPGDYSLDQLDKLMRDPIALNARIQQAIEEGTGFAVWLHMGVSSDDYPDGEGWTFLWNPNLEISDVQAIYTVELELAGSDITISIPRNSWNKIRLTLGA
jgi:hypothetical protein